MGMGSCHKHRFSNPLCESYPNSPLAVNPPGRPGPRAGKAETKKPPGPKGPAERVQPGAVWLARLCERPLLPVAFACRPCVRVGSWDRMIVPKPGTQPSEEGIREFCRGQIAHFKIPALVRFRDSLPMTVTGKPQKFLMRAAMVEELGLTEAATA